jgi:hypothetical protein
VSIVCEAVSDALLVHIDRDGESLCGMELHEGVVPLTSERREVTCVGCAILREDEAVQALAEVARLRAIILSIILRAVDILQDSTDGPVQR